MPHKTWLQGELVKAAPFNQYLQDQVACQFPDAATRDAQWSAPPLGALSTLDTNPGVLWIKVSAGWQQAGPLARYGASAVATNMAVPTGVATGVNNFASQATAGGATVSGTGITLPTTPGLTSIALRLVASANPAANQYLTGAVLMGGGEQCRVTLPGGINIGAGNAANVPNVDSAGPLAFTVTLLHNMGSTVNVSVWLYVYRIGV